ncbi:MAG: hypothetical protein ACW99G_16905 [Candidatus Thorarchaeota archaeon]|jgi:hypothetical protein
MKHVTIVCDLIATDEFNEQDVKKMLDSSPHVREAHMQVKIEKIEEDNDGLQHPDRRW